MLLNSYTVKCSQGAAIFEWWEPNLHPAKNESSIASQALSSERKKQQQQSVIVSFWGAPTTAHSFYRDFPKLSSPNTPLCHGLSHPPHLWLPGACGFETLSTTAGRTGQKTPGDVLLGRIEESIGLVMIGTVYYIGPYTKVCSFYLGGHSLPSPALNQPTNSQRM